MLRRLKDYRDSHLEARRLAAELEETQRKLTWTQERLALWRERAEKAELESFDAAKVVWIFGSGRSGSTWLASIMEEKYPVWREPLIGALFGEFFYIRAPYKTGPAGILGQPYRKVWIKGIRAFVLEGAAARNLESNYLIIKEPHGSVGAPLLSEALPESKFLFLIRDPRDVVASYLDARKRTGWVSERKESGSGKSLADENPDEFVRKNAVRIFRHMFNARAAYESHEGPKTLVHYENLLLDTLGEMRRIYFDLDIEIEETELVWAVKKHSWENIPEQDRGEGKFYRKATPGGWREDLSVEQIATVEKICAPILEEFYP